MPKNGKINIGVSLYIKKENDSLTDSNKMY